MTEFLITLEQKLKLYDSNLKNTAPNEISETSLNYAKDYEKSNKLNLNDNDKMFNLPDSSEFKLMQPSEKNVNKTCQLTKYDKNRVIKTIPTPQIRIYIKKEINSGRLIQIQNGPIFLLRQLLNRCCYIRYILIVYWLPLRLWFSTLRHINQVLRWFGAVSS